MKNISVILFIAFIITGGLLFKSKQELANLRALNIKKDKEYKECIETSLNRFKYAVDLSDITDECYKCRKRKKTIVLNYDNLK